MPATALLRSHWTMLAPVAGALAIGLVHLAGSVHGLLAIPVLALLILVVFASVEHAEALAGRLGPALGGLLLAVSVTVIELSLILSILLHGGSETSMVARDAVFASIMLTTTGITGLALLIAGARFGDAAFQPRGAGSLLSVLTVLSVLVLIVPNYTLAEGPAYSSVQLIFVAVVSLTLYAVLVFTQTVRHRELFLAEEGDLPERPLRHPVWVSALLLIACLTVVALLADTLAPAMHAVVVATGAPFEVAGVMIAVLVLLPEALVALKAAYRNKLQVSINVALGSALASIGLTIPAAAFVAPLLGEELILGISTEQSVLLALALISGTQTLVSGRATILQGAVHLTLCAAYLFLAFRP
ncbi:calcium:proton antiporter [Sandaracinobacteroides hominis]|uniref:calcium:proton antiporter n=1 Tax=Sandaracinobacteroides hominis TaxID=2780086 RepID=UPI0018F4E30D|nr:ionic transporter y4hA [Sandaracinobacteroides hominis]